MTGKKLKWLLGAIGVIFLGALGSGLWRWAFEPLSTWFGKSLFTIATLGLESLRDSIYVDVAKGLHEAPSLILLTVLLLIPMFALSGFSSYIVGEKLGRRDVAKLVSDAEEKFKNLPSKERENKIRAILESATETSHRKFVVHITAILAVVMVFCLFQLFIINYTNRAITHFQQCYSICRPFLTENQEEDIMSQYACIQSRADYVALIDRLYATAKKQGIKCPDFTPF